MPEWLGVFFGSTNGRRLLVAVAISIALHEIVAGLFPRYAQTQQAREVVTRAQTVRVAVRPSPTPAPRPPVPPALVPRPNVAVRAPENAPGRRRAGYAARAVAPPRVAFARHADTKPIWDVAAGGAGMSAGAGTGDAAASGNGSAATGTGTGAAGGDPPCGFVTFSDPHGSQYDARTGGFWVDIRMSVHFANGSAQSMILDYPWYYGNEAANPWSDQNLRDPNFATRFQPPPAAKLANEPALVRYVVAHSTAEGMTLLGDCPTPAP